MQWAGQTGGGGASGGYVSSRTDRFWIEIKTTNYPGIGTYVFSTVNAINTSSTFAGTTLPCGEPFSGQGGFDHMQAVLRPTRMKYVNSYIGIPYDVRFNDVYQYTVNETFNQLLEQEFDLGI